MGYRYINMSVKFRGHVCEIQIQLAAILEVKHDGHAAYELVRSLELEDELEEGPTLADLAGACSPATRVGLGALRFFAAAMAALRTVWRVGPSIKKLPSVWTRSVLP